MGVADTLEEVETVVESLPQTEIESEEEGELVVEAVVVGRGGRSEPITPHPQGNGSDDLALLDTLGDEETEPHKDGVVLVVMVKEGEVEVVPV